MPLSFDDHLKHTEKEDKLNAARQDGDMARFMAAAEKAADVVTKMEVTRTANLGAKIDAVKTQDFLS